MQPEASIRNELVALEKRYWNALREKDSSTATSLSDDPCVVVGAQGVSQIDKKTMAGMVENASYELHDFDLEDVHIRTVADGVVVVAYKVKEDLKVEGQDLTLNAFDSSVWVRRNGNWVCALHTESIAGDPFGRRG